MSYEWLGYGINANTWLTFENMLEYSYVNKCFWVGFWNFEVSIFHSKVLFSFKCKGNISESDILL